VPGTERWDAIWRKVVVVIDPSPTGGPWARIEWPEVPARARPTGPAPARRSTGPHAEIPGFVERRASPETPGWEEDKRAPTQSHLYPGQNISLDFKDGDLNDIFRLFADITGLNVVVHPGVQGHATLKFHGIPWDDALGRILAPNGLTYVLAGPILEIGPPEQLPPPREFVGKPTEVDFRQVDLREALTRVAKAGGRTVTVPPGVAGAVTLKLWGVPWDQAFDLIARLNGLAWKDDGKTIRVIGPIPSS
jgi:type II secretory pathway component HofQ